MSIPRHMTRPYALLGLLLGLVATAVLAAETTPLSFGEFYKSRGVLGLKLSDKAEALDGQRVTVKGFMAPSLKVDAGFFVLTRQPVTLCPFCNTDADWPTDIVVVYPEGGQEHMRFVQSNQPIAVSGVWEVGSSTDPETGFVSLLRIIDAEFGRL